MAYIHMSHEEFQRKLRTAPEDEYNRMLGPSPGYVAATLGISRQAVHNAIKRDSLTAYRITKTGGRFGKLLAIYVDPVSVKAYQNSDVRRRHTPKKYLQSNS